MNDLQQKWRLGKSFFHSWLAYTRDSTPQPFSASFVVTNRCNIHCSYCNFPNLNPAQLDLKSIERLFLQLVQIKVMRLGILGGEPLMRPDIGKIIDLAKKMKFFVSLNSNLLLYEKNRHKLELVDLFFTSLDGNSETHQRNRGFQHYDQILAALETITTSGKPAIAICVITENNLDQVPFLIEQAVQRRFKLHFQPQCGDTEIVRGKLSSSVSNKTLQSFWKDLLKAKQAGAPIASSTAYLRFLSRWEDFQVSAKFDPQQRCAAGRGFLFIDPQGNAYPCAYTQGKVAPISLLENSWQESFSKKTPCTTCSVGPMLEFNLLFQKPIVSAWNALNFLNPSSSIQ